MTSAYPSSPTTRVIIGYNAPPATTIAQQLQQQQQQQHQQQQSDHVIDTLTNTPTSRKSSDVHIYRTDNNYIYENQAFSDTTMKNQLFLHNGSKTETNRRDSTLYVNGGSNNNNPHKNEVRIYMYPPSNSMEPPIVTTTLSSAVNDLKLLVNGSAPSSSVSANGNNGYDGMTHILVQNRTPDGTHSQSYAMHQSPSVGHLLTDRNSSLSYVIDTTAGTNGDSAGRELAFVGGENAGENSSDSNVNDRKRRPDNESENDRARRRARDAETKRARRQRESSEQRTRRLLRDSQRMRRTRRIKRLLGPTATLSDLKKTGLTLEDLDSYSAGLRRGIRNSQSTYTTQQDQTSGAELESRHEIIVGGSGGNGSAHLVAQPAAAGQLPNMQIVAAAPPQNGAIIYDPRIQPQIITHSQAQPGQSQPMVVPLVAASGAQPQLLQTHNGNYVTVHWTLPPGADPNQVLHLPPGAPQHIIVQRSPPVTLTALPEDGKPHIIHVAPPPAQQSHAAQENTIITTQPPMIAQRHIINRSTDSAQQQQQQQKQQQSSSQQQHHHMQTFHQQQQSASINSPYQRQQQLMQQPQQQHLLQQSIDPQYHQTIVYRTAAPPLPRSQQQQQQQIQVDDYDINDYKEFIVHRSAPQSSNLRQQTIGIPFHGQPHLHPQAQQHTQQAPSSQVQRSLNSQQMLQGGSPSTSYPVHQIIAKGRGRGRSIATSEKNTEPSVYTAVPPPPRGVFAIGPPPTIILSGGATAPSIATTGVFTKRRNAKVNKKPKVYAPPPPLSERFRGLTEEQIRRRRRANAERSRRRRQLETPEQRRERNRRTAERMRARRARLANERFTTGSTIAMPQTSVTDNAMAPSLSSDDKNNIQIQPAYAKSRQVTPLSVERFEEIFERVRERCRNPSADDTMLCAIALPKHGEEVGTVAVSTSQPIDVGDPMSDTQMCATPSYIVGVVDENDKESGEVESTEDQHWEMGDPNKEQSQIFVDEEQNQSLDQVRSHHQEANQSNFAKGLTNQKLSYDKTQTDKINMSQDDSYKLATAPTKFTDDASKSAIGHNDVDDFYDNDAGDKKTDYILAHLNGTDDVDGSANTSDLSSGDTNPNPNSRIHAVVEVGLETDTSIIE